MLRATRQSSPSMRAFGGRLRTESLPGHSKADRGLLGAGEAVASVGPVEENAGYRKVLRPFSSPAYGGSRLRGNERCP